MQTTHVGSLPRPAELLKFIRGEEELPADYDARLLAATEAVFAKQLNAGIHFINDGELGRRDYVTAAKNRMRGFEAKKAAVGAADLEEMTEYSDRMEGRKGLLTLTKKTEVLNPACSGPIEFTDEGLKDLQAEIDRVVTAAKAKGVAPDRIFFSSPSPGTLANFFDDDYYKDHTKYVEALGKAMKSEYDAIHAAGLVLQVDCPDLAMGRHTRFRDSSLAEFQDAARMAVRVMNEAIAEIPAESLRMHVCWGNYPGPHHHDVPLADIIDLVLEAKPKYLSIEACNPGHGHEWEVFATKSFPKDKVIMPGVLDTTTSHIEHPRLIAQRLMNYVRLVGPERVIACTDCGFSTAAGAVNVPTEIVYAKLQSMVKGAAIADEMIKNESNKRQKVLDGSGYPVAETTLGS
jgi:5-methyltetrahydropteroyltriglutamate--homocysteine methyltransferase